MSNNSRYISKLLQDLGDQASRIPHLLVLTGQNAATVRSKFSEYEITQAYRRLSMLYHPDRHVNDLEEGQTTAMAVYKLLNEAHEKLLPRTGQIPIAINAQLRFYDGSIYVLPEAVDVYAFDDIGPNSYYLNFLTSLCLGVRVPSTRKRDDFEDVEFIVYYGDWHDNINHPPGRLGAVALKHLEPFLDDPPEVGTPVDKEENDVSTLVKRRPAGGIFLVVAPHHQDYMEFRGSELIAMGDYFDFMKRYAEEEIKEELFRMPARLSDFTGVEEIGPYQQEWSTYWGYLDENGITSVRAYSAKRLGTNELRRLQEGLVKEN